MVAAPGDHVGLAELAERAGTSPGYIRVLRARHADFPAPLVTLKMGPVWDWREVEAWLSLRRPNGRPRKGQHHDTCRSPSSR